MLAKDLLADWPAERWMDRRLVVGVSGGADSVALLLALREVAEPQRLVVAHLNHGWRGAESDQDAAFVVKLCAQLGVRCVAALLRDRDSETASQSDGIASRDCAMLAKGGVRDAVDYLEVDVVQTEMEGQRRTEEKAREARYQFFKKTAYEFGASYVVTAHTADDRIETLLHNMLRGAGLAGAASLVMFRPFDEDLVLVRPLLRKRRSDIEQFLAARGQSFRTDSSNLQVRYRRNFLRQQVLPLIAQPYPAAPDSLLNFSELAEELVADLNLLANRWLDRVGYPALPRAAAFHFSAPQSAVTDTPWSVVHAALRKVWLDAGWPQADMSRAHWHSLRHLCTQPSGTINLPGNLRAEASGGRMLIS